MGLKLVSFPLCPFVHRSTTLLHEKGVPFEIQYIDLKNKPEWFLKISPRGKVPVLQVDDAVLFESAIINEYLDETNAPRLLPESPLERARHRAWIELSSDLFMAHWKLTTEPTEQGFQAVLDGVKSTLSRFGEQVQGPFFAGGQFSLVDVAAAPALFRLTLLESRSKKPLLEVAPNVRTWIQEVAARPSVRKGVLPNFEDLYFGGLAANDSHFVRTFWTS